MTTNLKYICLEDALLSNGVGPPLIQTGLKRMDVVFNVNFQTKFPLNVNIANKI